jgi:hypothetical protein
MGIFSGALQLQQDTSRASWLLRPHTCQASILPVLGLLCKEWLLHWSSPGVVPLLQTGQLGHQKPNYLQYGQIQPFLPCCPCIVHRGLNHPWPSGCRQSPYMGGASHKYLPGGHHCQPSRHLQILASAHATGMPAHSYPDAWPSKHAAP